MAPANATTPELDVRTPIRAQRHALIFDRVAELAPGADFALVNDEALIESVPASDPTAWMPGRTPPGTDPEENSP